VVVLIGPRAKAIAVQQQRARRDPPRQYRIAILSRFLGIAVDDEQRVVVRVGSSRRSRCVWAHDNDTGLNPRLAACAMLCGVNAS